MFISTYICGNDKYYCLSHSKDVLTCIYFRTWKTLIKHHNQFIRMFWHLALNILSNLPVFRDLGKNTWALTGPIFIDISFIHTYTAHTFKGFNTSPRVNKLLH